MTETRPTFNTTPTLVTRENAKELRVGDVITFPRNKENGRQRGTITAEKDWRVEVTFDNGEKIELARDGMWGEESTAVRYEVHTAPASSRSTDDEPPERENKSISTVNSQGPYASLFRMHAMPAGYIVHDQPGIPGILDLHAAAPSDPVWRVLAPPSQDGCRMEVVCGKTLEMAERACFLHFIAFYGGEVALRGLTGDEEALVINDLFIEYVAPSGFAVEHSSQSDTYPWVACAHGKKLYRFKDLFNAKKECVRAYCETVGLSIPRGSVFSAEEIGRVATPQGDALAPKPQGVLGDDAKIREIRKGARALNDLIRESFPNSRKRSLALTKLEECVLWTVACTADDDD